MKWVFFADLHLNNNVWGRQSDKIPIRVQDVVNNLNLMIDFVLDNKVNLVLFGGDAYYNNHPSFEYKRIFYDAINRLIEHEVNTIMIVGNHDLTRKGYHALSEFSSLNIPFVQIIDSPQTISFGDILIHGLSWQLDGQLPKFNVNYDVQNICIAHGSLLGSELQARKINETDTLGDEFIFGLDYLSQFDWIGLGHIHKHQVLSRKPYVAYSGAMEVFTWGEWVTPSCGFLYYDNGITKHIPLPYRNRIRVKLPQDASKQDIINAIGNVDRETIYRVDLIEYPYPHEIERLLEDSFYYQVYNEKLPIKRRGNSTHNFSQMTHDEILQVYFDQIGVEFPYAEWQAIKNDTPL